MLNKCVFLNADSIDKITFNIAVVNKCYKTAQEIAERNVYAGNYFDLVVNEDDREKAPKLLFTLIRRLRKSVKIC